MGGSVEQLGYQGHDPGHGSKQAGGEGHRIPEDLAGELARFGVQLVGLGFELAGLFIEFDRFRRSAC